MTITRYHDVGVTINGKPVMTAPEPEILKRLVYSIKCNMKRGWLELVPVPAHNNEISIIGSGPNLEDAFFDYDHKKMMCVNQAHDWMIENGVTPNICVFMDNLPSMEHIIKYPHHNIDYYCASMASPELLDRLEGFTTHIWHCLLGYNESEAFDKPVKFVDGLQSVGLRAISLAYYLGFRNIQCFGLCGCVLDGEAYAFESKGREKHDKKLYNINYRGKIFQGLLEHTTEAGAFWKLLQQRDNAAITLHGRGLLPEMARDFWNERRDHWLEQQSTNASEETSGE